MSIDLFRKFIPQWSSAMYRDDGNGTETKNNSPPRVHGHESSLAVSAQTFPTAAATPPPPPPNQPFFTKDSLFGCCVQVFLETLAGGDLAEAREVHLSAPADRESKFRKWMLDAIQTAISSTSLATFKQRVNQKLTTAQIEEIKSDLVTGAKFQLVHVVAFCAVAKLSITIDFFSGRILLPICFNETEGTPPPPPPPEIIFFRYHPHVHRFRVVDPGDKSDTSDEADTTTILRMKQYNKILSPISSYKIHELRSLLQNVFDMSEEVLQPQKKTELYETLMERTQAQIQATMI